MSKHTQEDFQRNVVIESANEFAVKCGLKLMFENDTDSKWDIILNKCPYIPVSYLKDSAAYQLAYQKCHHGNWIDLSCVILWGDELAAVWPISLAQLNSGTTISSQGQPLLPPLFSGMVKKSAKRDITKLCINFLYLLSNLYRVERIVSSDPFFNNLGLNEWNFQLSELGAKCEICYDLYLQIQSSIKPIFRGFRRTLRDRIKQGQKLWKSGVLTSDSEDIHTVWQEFQNLHLDVSGRLTRSAETWELQKKTIFNSNAILVFLRDDKNKMIGGGYFTFSRDEALYAVAAYDRSLFKLPIGHLVQYIAIENFVRRGIKWYRIGNLPHSSEKPKPTEKELAIGDFKKQFSSHIFPTFKFEFQHNISITNE